MISRVLGSRAEMRRARRYNFLFFWPLFPARHQTTVRGCRWDGGGDMYDMRRFFFVLVEYQNTSPFLGYLEKYLKEKGKSIVF